jgi:glycosyltransferase involved in cell wall biosynthesis
MERILFITTSSNWPLTDGKRQRTWFLLEALSRKYSVDVLLISYQKDKDEFNVTNSTVNELFFVNIPNLGLSKINLPNVLLSKKQRNQKKIFFDDLNIFFCNLYVLNKYTFLFSRYLQPLLFLNIPKEIKIICDIDDVYFETQKSKIGNEKNFKKKLKLKILYLLELKKIKSILNRIDFPIIVKETDRKYYGLNDAYCLQNLPFSFYTKNKKLNIDKNKEINSEKLVFGFIGKLSYGPNYLGLIDFINSVWNSFVENNSQVKLLIAGSGEIPQKLIEVINSSKNIDLMGFVETPELFWDKISVLVVPVAEGGGSNIKIAEAFIHGKKVIAHPFASRGYNDFVESGHLILPKDIDSWIKAISSSRISSSEEVDHLIQKAKFYFDLDQWNEKLNSIISS